MLLQREENIFAGIAKDHYRINMRMTFPPVCLLLFSVIHSTSSETGKATAIIKSPAVARSGKESQTFC